MVPLSTFQQFSKPLVATLSKPGWTALARKQLLQAVLGQLGRSLLALLLRIVKPSINSIHHHLIQNSKDV